MWWSKRRRRHNSARVLNKADPNYLNHLTAAFPDIHGYTPNLDHPQLFSEKLLVRILRDDDPFYALYGTKLAAHFFYAARRIPGLLFPRRFKVVHRLSPADFDNLPKVVVVKSSFSSGLNRIVADHTREDLDALCANFNTKLPKQRNARGHRDPGSCILIEELLPGPNGGPPDDLKFHCFHDPDGGFRYILQIDTARFDDHVQSFLDDRGTWLDLTFGDCPRHAARPILPGNLDDLVRIARAISQDFDYIRVDLYSSPQGIHFGEVTPFHQGCMGKIGSMEWEQRLGDMWHQRLPSYQGSANAAVTPVVAISSQAEPGSGRCKRRGAVADVTG